MIGKIILFAAILYLIWKRSDLCAGVGRALYQRGHLEKGLTWYQRGAKIGKMNVNNRISYAYLTLKSGDLDEAAKIFTLISMDAIKPVERLHLNASRALVFWKQGDIDQAIELLEEVVDKAPTTASYGSLGYMYAYNGRLTDALAFNQKALEYNESDPIIVDNMAYTYLQMGEYAKAEEQYARLFALNPTFPEGYFEFGKYLVECGRKNEGLDYVRKALECQFSFLSMITRHEVISYLEQMDDHGGELV